VEGTICAYPYPQEMSVSPAPETSFKEKRTFSGIEKVSYLILRYTIQH
jgi:hypothetical protein